MRASEPSVRDVLVARSTAKTCQPTQFLVGATSGTFALFENALLLIRAMLGNVGRQFFCALVSSVIFFDQLSVRTGRSSLVERGPRGDEIFQYNLLHSVPLLF